MKIALKVPFVYAGNRYSSGDIVDLPPGVKGPTRTGIGGEEELLYDILDEDTEKERAELSAKHAKERAVLDHTEDHTKERAELHKKHNEERKAFRIKTEAKEIEKRHAREAAALKERHAREQKAFEARAAIPIAPPPETDPEELKKRHEAEDKALAAKHEADKAALKPAAEVKAVA